MTRKPYDVSVSYARKFAMPRLLDNLTGDAAMSVYCQCGHIVILDRAEMKVKLNLGKELECMSCRNARISKEIDALNDHFNGIEEVEDWLL